MDKGGRGVPRPHTGPQTDRQTDRDVYTQTHRHIDRQTDRQRRVHTDTQTHRHIDRQTAVSYTHLTLPTILRV